MVLNIIWVVKGLALSGPTLPRSGAPKVRRGNRALSDCPLVPADRGHRPHLGARSLPRGDLLSLLPRRVRPQGTKPRVADRFVQASRQSLRSLDCSQPRIYASADM